MTGTNQSRNTNRHSLRLRNYDYTTAGFYFVTIVTRCRRCLFGEIAFGIMQPNDAGRAIEDVWRSIPKHYSGIDIDQFVLMPNHVHGIITLAGATTEQGRSRAAPPQKPLSLPDLIQ